MEIVTFLVTMFLRTWQLNTQSRLDTERIRSAREAHANESTIKFVNAASKLYSRTPLPIIWAMAAISIMAGVYIFIMPIVAPFFHIPVSYMFIQGPSEFSFLFIINTMTGETVKFITQAGFVITPLHTNIIAAIFGFLFPSLKRGK